MSWMQLCDLAILYPDNERVPFCTIAAALPVQDGWRAVFSAPMPLLLRDTFDSLAEAQAACDAVMAAPRAHEGDVLPTANDASDTFWAWTMRERGDYATRYAGGAVLRVEQTADGEWLVTVDGSTIRHAFATAQRAQEWIDNYLPAPSPSPMLGALARELREATRSAAQRSLSNPELFPRLFAAAVEPLIAVLRQVGMDEAGETALVRSLVTGGRRPVLWQPGYVAEIV